MMSATSHKIYLAAPLFSQAECRWNAELAKSLRHKGLTVFLPQEASRPFVAAGAILDPRGLFAALVEGISESQVVVGILDGADADAGTCWELGFAYALGIPVLGVRTDLRKCADDPSGVNLMLAQCAAKPVFGLGLSLEQLAAEIDVRVREVQ